MWSSPNGNCIVVSRIVIIPHKRDVVRACVMDYQTVARSGFSLGKRRRNKLLAGYAKTVERAKVGGREWGEKEVVTESSCPS